MDLWLLRPLFGLVEYGQSAVFIEGVCRNTCHCQRRYLQGRPAVFPVRATLKTSASSIVSDLEQTMAFSLYAATIPSYQQILGAVSGLLGSAEAFCGPSACRARRSLR
jgi:hypothetical protein